MVKFQLSTRAPGCSSAAPLAPPEGLRTPVSGMHVRGCCQGHLYAKAAMASPPTATSVAITADDAAHPPWPGQAG